MLGLDERGFALVKAEDLELDPVLSARIGIYVGVRVGTRSSMPAFDSVHGGAKRFGTRSVVYISALSLRYSVRAGPISSRSRHRTMNPVVLLYVDVSTCALCAIARPTRMC